MIVFMKKNNKHYVHPILFIWVDSLVVSNPRSEIANFKCMHILHFDRL